MAQQTMTEKDMFLQTFDRECQTTLKVLHALPANQGDYRPHPRSKTAKELAWTFTVEQGICDHAIQDKLDFSKPMQQGPATLAETIAAFEKSYAETKSKVAKTSDEELQKLVQFPSGPGRMGEYRVMDLLWFTLMDQVHHRGQLSVYVRLAGGKVPSIYGPTADEPWM
jgi:uncharacterized damage-inducible protein DinB